MASHVRKGKAKGPARAWRSARSHAPFRRRARPSPLTPKHATPCGYAGVHSRRPPPILLVMNRTGPSSSRRPRLPVAVSPRHRAPKKRPPQFRPRFCAQRTPQQELQGEIGGPPAMVPVPPVSRPLPRRAPENLVHLGGRHHPAPDVSSAPQIRRKQNAPDTVFRSTEAPAKSAPRPATAPVRSNRIPCAGCPTLAIPVPAASFWTEVVPRRPGKPSPPPRADASPSPARNRARKTPWQNRSKKAGQKEKPWAPVSRLVRLDSSPRFPPEAGRPSEGIPR